MDSYQLGRAHNDHNVYILGAGFSAEANMPLVKGFMNRMRDAAAWLEERGGRGEEVQAIARVLEFRLRAAAAAYRVPIDVENIEELFSLASASGDKNLAEAMPLAIAATLDYARSTAPPLAEEKYFNLGVLDVPGWKKPRSWQPPIEFIRQRAGRGDLKGAWHGCPPYDFYLGVMAGYFYTEGSDSRNTIVSFNYDLLVEDALDSLGVAFNYGLPAEDIVWGNEAPGVWRDAAKTATGVQILKLHGSVNWSLPLFRSVLTEDPEPKDGDLIGDLLRLNRSMAVHRDYRALLKNGSKPFLVPPTWRKEFGGQLAGMWDLAVNSLRTATRIIVLGYSVPLTDQHFKYLLAAGLQDNISLREVFFVNPALADQDEEKKIKERLSGLFRAEHFDHGIVTLVQSKVRDFFARPATPDDKSYRSRIGRPLNPAGAAWDATPWTLYNAPPYNGDGPTSVD